MIDWIDYMACGRDNALNTHGHTRELAPDTAATCTRRIEKGPPGETSRRRHPPPTASAPAIGGGVLYVGSMDGNLDALEQGAVGARRVRHGAFH